MARYLPAPLPDRAFDRNPRTTVMKLEQACRIQSDTLTLSHVGRIDHLQIDHLQIDQTDPNLP